MNKEQNRKFQDLTGKQFGRLTVIGRDPRKSRKPYWTCVCECGNIKAVRGDILKAGLTRSCGCMKKEQDAINLINTPKKKTEAFGMPYGHLRIHEIWANMRKRCSNPKDARYMDYGGRGIKVCKEWDDDFVKFYNWAMESGYADDLTIDRIDNDKGYFPENCRWVNFKTQSRNRRTNIKITIGNATKTLTEWCEIFELPYSVVHARYQRHGFTTIDDLFRS